MVRVGAVVRVMLILRLSDDADRLSDDADRLGIMVNTCDDNRGDNNC